MPEALKTRSSIFPVLLLTFPSPSEIAVGKVKDGVYLGTGFFARFPTFVAFITARHVVEIRVEPHQRIGIASLSDDGKYWWESFEHHHTADLAFARFQPDQLRSFVRPLPILPDPPVLERGTPVHTFGFPFTTRSPAPDGKVAMTIEELFFSGYIATHYDRDLLVSSLQYPFGVNYALSFEVPAGLSGAPLLVVSGGAPHVCGLVYANRSIHMQVEEYEETDTPGGPIVKTRVVRAHHLGLASSIAEIASIPPL